jgi:hypothetical protein
MLQASRVGDVERVKYLVQREAVDVNKRDRWDSVPLYYACLAGAVCGARPTCRRDMLVALNYIDRPDPTDCPWLACCSVGHPDVAEVLLERGAICNEWTFDGEFAHLLASGAVSVGLSPGCRCSCNE